MKQKELEAIARLIKRQVQREVERELEERTKLIRMEVISEVATMLNYSERKIMTQLDEHRSSTIHENNAYDQSGEILPSDFQRSMNNLKTMPAFNHITEKVTTPQQRQQKTYTQNSMLNSILNETTGFSKNELREHGGGDMFNGMLNFGNTSLDEPWENTNTKVSMFDTADDDGDDDEFNPSIFTPQSQTQTQVQHIQTPSSPILGTDMKPIDVNNPTVQKVLGILNNTNHKKKFEEIDEMGNNFRGGGAPAPRYNSQYFIDSMVVD